MRKVNPYDHDNKCDCIECVDEEIVWFVKYGSKWKTKHTHFSRYAIGESPKAVDIATIDGQWGTE